MTATGAGAGVGSPYLTEGAVLAGRYCVGRELGHGGFSVVYLARIVR